MRDPVPPQAGSGGLIETLDSLRTQVGTLSQFTGADYVQALQKIDDLIAGLPAQVGTITAAYLAANTYTRADVDARIASPGAITPSSVVAGGQVSASSFSSDGTGQFDQGVRSVGARNNVVTNGYAGLWADGAGNFGIAPSSRRLKKNITNWLTDITKLLTLQPVMFRFKSQSVDEPKQIGLIAEDVVAAGFPEFTFTDDDGNVQGINYDRLSVAVLALAQEQQKQIQILADRLTAAGL